ncbi:sigma-70 family RNA polymerase sigma factor [Frigoriglobus tundricola]|uniref:ECF RNA polymerase sigma factor SigE n=1 Tax=Frigoriglobus tundricola TaxID=2774151 RepID=A0A6M5Z298_9BACT|nr:sigma-70 family RNA polymerase sigma factor [Frigoriglobus tundricola]QJW99571.1 hypothetical protein FTUN_7183 [Frigoriglobus tundricola]
MSATVVIRSLSRTGRPDLDDTVLLTTAAGGDETAFAELVRRHGPMVLGVCRRVLGPSADADDAFQTTFLSLLQHAQSVRTPTALPAWLHQTACRAAVKIRARKPALTHAPDPTIEPDPLADLSWKEVRAMLDEELNALPERLRAPLVLCFLDGRTRDDAARAIGVSLSTLKRRIADGLERLNRRLRRRGVVGGGLALAALDGRRLAAQVSAPLTARVVAASGTRAMTPGLSSSLLTGWKAAMSVVLLAGGLAAGAGLVMSDGPTKSTPPKEETADTKARSDAFGDPLPEGAVMRLGSVLFRHDGVRDFVLLPDGKSVLTSGSDHQLRTWDLTTGRETRKIPEAANVQWRGALSPDGRYGTGFAGMNLTVFDTETGKEKTSFPAPGTNFHSTFFSPDGNTLAVLTSEPRLTLVQWQTNVTRELSLPAGALMVDSSFHGYFSPDGKWLVAGCGQWKALCVFDVATGTEKYHLECDPSHSTVAPDGKTLVASLWKPNGQKGSELATFDLTTGKETARFDLKARYSYHSLDVSPDSKTLACSFSNESCSIDLRTGRVLHELLGRPLGAVFTRDGKHVVATTGQKLRVWTVADGKEVFDRPGNLGQLPVLAASPDGRWLASADWVDRGVSIWDLTDGRLLRTLPFRGEEGRYVRDLSFSPDGRTLWAGSYQGFVQWWDWPTGKETRAVKLDVPSHNVPRPDYLYRIRVSSNGKTAAALDRVWTTPESTNLVVWDVASGAVKGRRSLPPAHRHWAWTGDGSAVAFSTSDGLIVADGNDPSRTRFTVPGVGANARLAFSADGRLLAAQKTQDKELKESVVIVVETATGAVAAVVKTGPLDHLALAANGRTLVTAGSSSVEVFDTATGAQRLQRSLPAPATELLLPGETRALTSLADGTGLVWDLTASAGLPKPGTEAPTRLWDALAGANAAAAHKAAWELVDRPAETVALLREKLKPARTADETAVKALIAKLDAPEFADREAATKALQLLGSAAAPALRAALRGDLSAEQDDRLRRLLAATNAPIVPAGDPLREVRAVAILEHIGTAEARKLLEEWAAGAPDAYVTREATAATARLKRPANR